MIDLEGLWRDAKAATPVCAVTGATKNMILNAITEGARTLEDIEKTVPLCGGECALRNVSGCGCRENAAALLKIYVPVFEMMTEGGGCRHGRPAPKPEGMPRRRAAKNAAAAPAAARSPPVVRKAKNSAPRGIFRHSRDIVAGGAAHQPRRKHVRSTKKPAIWNRLRPARSPRRIPYRRRNNSGNNRGRTERRAFTRRRADRGEA